MNWRQHSDHSPVAVEQDFYALTFLSNMATVVAEDAQPDAEKRLHQSSHPYKYTEYRIN